VVRLGADVRNVTPSRPSFAGVTRPLGRCIVRQLRRSERPVVLFQSFWFGDDLPRCPRVCMSSFVEHGHEFHLYSYRPLAVPAGVRNRDAREILPAESVFLYPRGAEKGSVAGFANWFRYELLLARGGWWVDADVLCRSPRVPEADLFIGRENDEALGTAILKLPAGHRLARRLSEECRRAGSDIVWAQTGPRLMTSLVREEGLWESCYPSAFAYPIPWQDALDTARPEKRDDVLARIAGAPFLHLWNEIFRQTRSSGLVEPPPGSFLADVFAHHAAREGEARAALRGRGYASAVARPLRHALGRWSRARNRRRSDNVSRGTGGERMVEPGGIEPPTS
jgi:hypothetical protein